MEIPCFKVWAFEKWDSIKVTDVIVFSSDFLTLFGVLRRLVSHTSREQSV